MPGVRRFVALLALVTGAAACGSTVQVSSGGAALGGTTDGLGGASAAPGGTGAAPVAGGAQPGGSTGALQGSATGGGAPGPQAGPAGTTGSSSAPIPTSVPGRKVRGVTATTITVGVFYASDGKEAVGALGGSADRGNEKDAYDAIFGDINEHGGIAGRKVVPKYFMLDFGDQRPRDQQEQPACEFFTHDNSVFAVLTTKAGGATDSFKACLERAGVVHIAGNFTVAGDATYRQFRHYVEPDGLSIERSAAAVPGSLAERKWLTPWSSAAGRPAATGAASIGVVAADYPTFQHAVDSVLVPGLKAVGAKVEQVVRVSTTDNAAAQSAIANAVLSFRSRGVTHVLFLQFGGGVPLLFLQQASNQSYYPRYGFTSQDVMPLMQEAGLIPNAGKAFTGALGVGWWPSADTSYGKSEYSKKPAAQACLALLKRKNQSPVSALQETLAYFHCDVVAVLKQAVEAGGPVITPDSFLVGLDKVAKPFGAAGTPRSVLSSARRDGASVVRGFAFSGECGCWVLDGKERSVA